MCKTFNPNMILLRIHDTYIVQVDLNYIFDSNHTACLNP